MEIDNGISEVRRQKFHKIALLRRLGRNKFLFCASNMFTFVWTR